MYCTHCSEPIAALTEICTKCGVRPYITKNFCHSCGSKVDCNQAMCIACGSMLKEIKKTQAAESYHPAIIGILSFFLVGLGQIIMGQIFKGLVMLVVSFILTLITLGLSSFIITPINVIDAVLIANKKRQGKQVGKWEFF